MPSNPKGKPKSFCPLADSRWVGATLWNGQRKRKRLLPEESGGMGLGAVVSGWGSPSSTLQSLHWESPGTSPQYMQGTRILHFHSFIDMACLWGTVFQADQWGITAINAMFTPHSDSSTVPETGSKGYSTLQSRVFFLFAFQIKNIFQSCFWWGKPTHLSPLPHFFIPSVVNICLNARTSKTAKVIFSCYKFVQTLNMFKCHLLFSVMSL